MNKHYARTLCTLGTALFALSSSLATAQSRDDYRRDDYGEMRQTVARISFLSGSVSFSRGDDSDYWHRVEEYVCEHADVKFSHGICPDCYKKHIEPQLG